METLGARRNAKRLVGPDVPPPSPRHLRMVQPAALFSARGVLLSEE